VWVRPLVKQARREIKLEQRRTRAIRRLGAAAA
jgi:hypothetical protein